jgi:hypothetical protein
MRSTQTAYSWHLAVLAFIGCCALLLLPKAEGFQCISLGGRPQASVQSCVKPTATTTIVQSSKNDDKDLDSILDDDSYEPQYGVSFIGGDPCGSKLNDDPHDVKMQKPGMPDDMKARIQALTEKRKREEEKAQKKKENETEE